MSEDPGKTNQYNVSSTRYPLVHKLVQFADLRRYYAEMREALKASNRQAGAYKGWVTRWKNKAAGLEIEKKRLEVEVESHIHEKQVLSEQLKRISEEYTGMDAILTKLENFETAVDELRRLKLVSDGYAIETGYWSNNAQEELRNGVDNFLEAVDRIMDEEWDKEKKDMED